MVDVLAANRVISAYAEASLEGLSFLALHLAHCAFLDKDNSILT